MLRAEVESWRTSRRRNRAKVKWGMSAVETSATTLTEELGFPVVDTCLPMQKAEFLTGHADVRW